jgi:NTE family protein
MIESTTDQTSKKQPRIGVAIGGGGLKAMSSIALFRFLDLNGLRPDIVAGCSAGALVAAMRGAGFSYSKMQEVAFAMSDPKMFGQYNTRSILGIASLPGGVFNNRSGLMNPKRVLSFYHELFGGLRLEDLDTKTVLVATDITKGEKITLESGLVADAVFASGALWPLFPPIEFQGRLLIDGGYSNPLPLLELVQQEKSDINIAMMFDEKPDPDPKGFAQCLNNQVGIMLRTMTRNQNMMAVEMHHYETIFIQFVMSAPVLMSPDSVPLVLDTGRKLVNLHAQDILDAVKNFDIPVI